MTEGERIRVMLIDDHAVVRSGLSALLMFFKDLQLVGETGDGEEGVRLCRQVQPDVVLMDLVMPGMDGIAATKAIKEHCPQTHVIALTSFTEDERVQAVLKAGAIGYLLKNVSALELVAAIRGAAAGQPTLSSEVAHTLMRGRREPRHQDSGLTQREQEVLSLMARGLNNAQIAELLVVSTSTAKYHVRNILSKLRAGTRTEAVALGMRNHLIDAT